MVGARLAIVTGKGGVGKTTVTAALARAAIRAGQRVLLVEARTPGRLASVLGVSELDPEPRLIDRDLFAVALDAQRALEALVHQMMPLRLLSRRLLSSDTFRVVAAAVPGIPEAAMLAQVVAWLGEGDRLRGPRWDLVVLDAPASGHSVPLLAAPGTLSGLATVGPLGQILRRISARLTDPLRTTGLVVSIPEPWAIAEAVELYGSLRDALHIPLARPIVNAVFPRRFSRREEALLDQAEASGSVDSRLLAAGRYFLRRRAEAQEQIRALRAGTQERPVELPFLFAADMGFSRLDPLAEALWSAIA